MLVARKAMDTVLDAAQRKVRGSHTSCSMPQNLDNWICASAVTKLGVVR